MAGSDRDVHETDELLPKVAATADESSGPDGTDPTPPRDVHLYLGSQLRAAFDDVASQPIPDRFLELMRKLG